MILRMIQHAVYRMLGKDLMPIRIKEYQQAGMKIGGGCRIFSILTTAELYLIEIGNNVTISTNVSLITHDNSAIKIFDEGTDFVGKIKIGDSCFIGANSTLLPGVTLADRVIVGAGSVVTKSFLTAGTVIAGNPARVIGTVELIRERYKNNVFDFSGENRQKKKMIVLNHPEMYIKK